MICPKCGEKMACVDSRNYKTYSLRRYKCKLCGSILKTKEGPANEEAWNEAHQALVMSFGYQNSEPESSYILEKMEDLMAKSPEYKTKKVRGKDLQTGDLVEIGGGKALIISHFNGRTDLKYLFLEPCTYTFGVITEDSEVTKIEGKLEISGIR